MVSIIYCHQFKVVKYPSNKHLRTYANYRDLATGPQEAIEVAVV